MEEISEWGDVKIYQVWVKSHIDSKGWCSTIYKWDDPYTQCLKVLVESVVSSHLYGCS
jgi:hypothetical protein